MAIPYADRKAKAAEPAFRDRVEAALVEVCMGVLTEDPNTANHRTKVQYANQAINDLSTWVPRVAFGVLSLPSGEVAYNGDDAALAQSVFAVAAMYVGAQG